MIDRSAFTPVEWRIVCQAPTYAGLLVTAAQRGGFLWEVVAIARTFEELRESPGHSFVDEILAAGPRVERVRFRSVDDARSHGLELIRVAVAVIEQKGDTADVDAFGALVLRVAETVARADAVVSTAERDMLARIAAAARLPEGARRW